MTGYNCPRCDGNKTIQIYANVLGGICFQCKGSGKVASKPAAKSKKWACIYDGKALFNISARTEKAALKKATGHFRCHQDAPAFAGLTESDISVEAWAAQ